MASYQEYLADEPAQVDDRFVIEVRRVAGLVSGVDPVIGAMIRDHAPQLGAALAAAYPGYFRGRQCRKPVQYSDTGEWTQCPRPEWHEGDCDTLVNYAPDGTEC